MYIKGSISIDSCSLENNLSLRGRGGALCAVEKSSLSIQRSNFEGNSALRLGPAIYMESGGIYNGAGNDGCGNTASIDECDGLYRESKRECDNFKSICSAPSEGWFMYLSHFPNHLVNCVNISPQYHRFILI